MVMVEALFVIGLVGLMVFAVVSLLGRSVDERRPTSLLGTWQVAHYDAKGETHIVLGKISDSGSKVLDEHVITSFRADDPEYEARFMAGMDTARQRQALFEAEDES